jgi:hypothetical protein
MILYLGLLTSHLVNSLVELWYINSIYLWWGSWSISLDSKSSNSKRAPSSAKLNTFKTPMGTNGHLDLDTGGKSIDQKVYRSMIVSLLYLCASRPDIMLSVCMCARFQVNPKEVHLRAVKRIMRYLVYTPNFGLWYPKGSTFDLIGYFDVDYAGCKIDRKSTSGTCQFPGRSLVSWASKK